MKYPYSKARRSWIEVSCVFVFLLDVSEQHGGSNNEKERNIEILAREIAGDDIERERE